MAAFAFLQAEWGCQCAGMIQQMSKNYSYRSQTAQKVSPRKLELPGFNLDNVIIDQDTQSPRLLTSFAENGMRRLDPYEKKLYYEHEAKLKDKKPKEQDKILAKTNPAVDLSKYVHQGAKGEVRKQGVAEGGFANVREKLLAQNKKRIFEQESYGLPLPKKQKQEVPIQRDEYASLAESMTDSTAKLVEKVVREERMLSQDPDFAVLAAEVAALGRRMKQEQEDNRASRELIQKLWERTCGPRQEGNVGLTAQNERLRQQVRQLEVKLSAAEADRKVLVRSLETSRANYDGAMLKCRDFEVAAREQQANYDKLTVALRECEGKLRQSESRCEYLEGRAREGERGKVGGGAKFCSETAILSDLSGFLCEQIEKFTGRAVRRARLVFQKDDHNTNLSYYLERPSFPVVLLLQSGRGWLFGAFAEGIENLRSGRGKEEMPFRGFLFNGNARTLFAGSGRQSVLSYYENYLKLGNNELGFKNHNLGVMSFSTGSIFAEKCFTIPRRHHLTGEDSENVEIATFEVFEVFLE